MTDTGELFIGAKSGGADPQNLVLKRANRHGLIAGATGTGKTVSLQVLAEGLSRDGVPVFLSDVKGDLSGIALPGSATAKTHEAFQARATDLGIQLEYAGNPVVFWDLFGQQGHPVRATVSEMGPLLLARLLDLNETQEGVLAIAFKVADDQGLLLLDLKDLKQIWPGAASMRKSWRPAMAMSPRNPSAPSSASCSAWNRRARPISSANRRLPSPI